MNQYLFMVGSDAAKATTNGPARVTVKEAGPLVASLVAESDAPGAARLSREVVLTAGLDRVVLSTTVDKKRAPAGPKGDYYQPASKESVNLAFPFDVPGGEVRLELPLGGVIRPERRSDRRLVQELVRRRQLGGCLGGRPRRDVGHARHAAGPAGRAHRESAELADRPEGLARERSSRRRSSIRG